MARHKKNKNKEKKARKFSAGREGFFSRFALPEETKKWIFGLLIFIIAIIVALSFFDLAGVAGKAVIASLTFLVGKAVFLIPLILVLGGLVAFSSQYENVLGPAILAILVLTIGIAGTLESFYPGINQGGWLGYFISWPVLKLLGGLVPKIIFSGVILAGLFIFWHLMRGPKKIKSSLTEETPEKEGLIKKIFTPKFQVKEVEPQIREDLDKEKPAVEPKQKTSPQRVSSLQYKLPPLDLLEVSKGKPLAGDTITSSTIIKKTLENFGMGVEMSEVNIGPTVTQYTLKPDEGIKLSKITALSNNLSLALASHPIRIEAPIPGKSLVGVEVPNKERCRVGLRDMLSQDGFQKSESDLVFVLGKDVSGHACFADLSRMPHLLVAGATGTGKTIFLNNLILSLLYQNSPEILRFILVDPKRVEFSAYKELPHLLAPVIYDAQRAVSALRWLGGEMERRFSILSSNGSRNIASFNEKILKTKEGEILPYIILIIDELADLMSAKGREIEGGIVRLAQMARAVGIHLVVATQRPSVEVITGLIKANITSRVTFQVASQVDSRTVLDMAGAEKLLGLGDLLFISAEVSKPRRIQGAYVSEKEVKKVIDWIKEQQPRGSQIKLEEGLFENGLSQDLAKSLEGSQESIGAFEGGDDPLYEEAKKIVIEANKASASLLQRRLRVGYARAARLLDMLEEKGVVGPGEGARPREITQAAEDVNESISPENPEVQDEEEGEDWQKV